ncbi:MAG: Gfo/Idh/MocA family oxidoreductase [Chloroflexi bacterium]|nr:Gfo/Idh/MocA family oxidoreductase [Chloroflexota bacterium]
MSDRRLRWGLLSTARINRSLIPALRASPRCELVAVASRDAGRAEAYAQEWGIPQAYGSYQALLEDPQIDVVYISLPNSLHAEWAVRAAQASKHVLCEKPLATDEADVQRMIQAARRAGVVLMEAFMYRCHPQMARVRELIAAGRLGEPRLVHTTFSFHLGRTQDVRWDPRLDGGALWDVGCYTVNFCRFALGAEPSQVFGWQRPSSSGVDEAFVGLLHFPSDALGLIEAGFVGPLRRRAELVGTKGALILEDPWKPGPTAMIRIRGLEGEETIPVLAQDLYLHEVEHLADCVLEGKEPLIPLEESLGNVRTLVALYRSAREGRPVRL